jgi:hypothetical protein
LEQKRGPENQDKGKIGHFDFCKYPFFQTKERKIRLHGKRKTKEKFYLEIKDLIDKDVTSTTELASRLGKSTRQIRRYLIIMSQLHMIKLDAQTGRLVQKEVGIFSMSRHQFAKIPEITKWMDDCIVRQIKPTTMQKYLLSVRYMFRLVKGIPKNVVSSKESAIEFWTKFIVEYRKQNPAKGTQHHRVSFKNLLASFNILFPPHMGKVYGLSSAHDKYGVYAGVCFSGVITEEIGKMMLENGDIELYTWWRTGLRTGARNRAIAKMTWDHIYFDETNEDGTESFRLEQHETKDPRGHWFLGENGDWKTKYPPLDLKRLLLEWKKKSPNSRFLWFEDGESDAYNSRNAKRKAMLMARKFRPYYEKIAHKVDPLTKEYMLKKPTHIMRHTLAQQMKEAGFTNEEIADSFGWRTSGIVGTWYTKTSEKKRKELG